MMVGRAHSQKRPHPGAARRPVGGSPNQNWMGARGIRA